jgi:hypothetical protein
MTWENEMMKLKNRFKKPASRIKAQDIWAEKAPLFISLFLFAFGMGMIADGKKMYANQLRLSERVDYRATFNPFPKN